MYFYWNKTYFYGYQPYLCFYRLYSIEYHQGKIFVNIFIITFMKKILHSCLRSVLFSVALILLSFSSRASHIIGADMFYTWQSGNTYKVTVILYGDCASNTGPGSAYSSLPTSHPQVCVYNGGTLLATLTLDPDAASAAGGTEITPVCADSINRTQCTSLAFHTPGIKKFTYTKTYTFTSTSSVFRFVYTANNGGTSAGRTSAITNLVSPGSTMMQLIDTLNNTTGPNTSPLLTVVPTPFFAENINNCYTPGAIDPDGDSLSFDLIAATNGTTSCGTVGGAVAYTGAFVAWPGQPLTPATPLRVISATDFNFDGTTGQVCFRTAVTQRSVVVFNIREYRGGVFVGSSQREMNFYTDLFDTATIKPGVPNLSGGLDFDNVADSFKFHVCGHPTDVGPAADADTFSLSLSPSEVDATRRITCTVSGLAPSSGLVFSVVDNNTNAPICKIKGNSATMVPGIYNFVLTFKDDGCPITNVQPKSYRITILPVPTISITKVADADCTNGAIVRITPGGTGGPWIVKTIDTIIMPLPTTIPLPVGYDTTHFHTDTLAFNDTLDPGQYTYIIYTSVSNKCGLFDTISLTAPPKLRPDTAYGNPTYCGNNDGWIRLDSLNAGALDTVYFTYTINGTDVVLDTQYRVVGPDRSILLDHLRAGIYKNIVVRYSYCTSDTLDSIILVDPPFEYRAITQSNATKCGYCDGFVKIWGLHPGQLDTISYSYTPPVGPTVFDTMAFYVGPDSSILVSGACKGSYNNFLVHTAGVCRDSSTDVVYVNAPIIDAQFDTLIRLGCEGDTMKFINQSTPATDLYYSWQFGDATTSNAANPVHVYTNTSNATYTIKLYVSNTKCLDSAWTEQTFNNTVDAGFTISRPAYLCQQLDTMRFTNTSTGTGVNYTWYFGDGTTDIVTDPIHIYTNAGTQNAILVAENSIHCRDTATLAITVDSITVPEIGVKDMPAALCKGQAITLPAKYVRSGDTANVWTISDGFSIANVNELTHAFEGTGTFTVSLSALFRACPEQRASRTFTVFDYPTLYLGPDLTICPGSNPIELVDTRNGGNPAASFQWNTSETTPAIAITKPGDYVASVTIDGCTTSDTVSVLKDCYMDIPNVFTPNGDGTNDYFFPRKFLTRGVKTFKMNIYNRWGQLIYETAGTDGQGWDGALNGTQQPSGVYVYIIDATYKDGQIEHHTGNVTILR